MIINMYVKCSACLKKTGGKWFVRNIKESKSYL